MLKKLLQNISKSRSHAFDPSPEAPFIAVGDIHGRSDLLRKFLAEAPKVQIVLVGDYIDRGDDSAGVLHLLSGRSDLICLSGNHEELMLNFIDAPQTHGARWLRYGGLQTLASYGIAGMTETSDPDAMSNARDALVNAMGEQTLSWLRARPTHWQSGNVSVIHAGANPKVPVAEQSARTHHWGHPNFKKTPRNDGVMVVHGHTIVDAPQNTHGRIAIDTGAYATGRLTSVYIDQSQVRFETTTL